MSIITVPQTLFHSGKSIQFQNGSKIPDKILVGCVKKKSTLYEIFRFFRFLIKKLLL